MDKDQIEAIKQMTDSERQLSSNFFGLVTSRSLKRAYKGFSEETKAEMDKVFSLSDDKPKEKFIKENIPDFKKMFQEEADKLSDDIKKEIEKRLV